MLVKNKALLVDPPFVKGPAISSSEKAVEKGLGEKKGRGGGYV